MPPAGDPAGGLADSAGVPWAGRTLTGQPFAGDDGTTDPGLLTALACWRDAGDRAALIDVVRAWAPTRVLVPIVAVLGEGEDLRSAAEHGQGDKSADMALVTITGPDGRRILPTFSSTQALAAWNAGARPVPVEAARAAQAAVLEGCDLIAIDPAGPVDCLLPRPAVWAVAQGRDWSPPAGDPELLAAVAAIAASVPGLVAHRCEPDGVAGLNVVLGLPPGLESDQVEQITGRMSQLLAADDLVAERADSLRLTVRPAWAPAAQLDQPTSDQALAGRWARDVRSGAAEQAGAGILEAAGAELIARWREPHRRYHTVTHLVAVLAGVDELAGRAEDIAAVRLAAWFHDAVYRGRPGADEEDSAVLAERVLPALGWPPERVAEVGRLIRLTGDHAGIGADDRNAGVLADADLAVLALAGPDYLAYTRAVREEYAHIPDDLFAAGRTQILTRLLESAPLYRTPAAQADWTSRAEANLRSELARLGCSPAPDGRTGRTDD